jgi:hypothetical protein
VRDIFDGARGTRAKQQPITAPGACAIRNGSENSQNDTATEDQRTREPNPPTTLAAAAPGTRSRAVHQMVPSKSGAGASALGGLAVSQSRAGAKSRTGVVSQKPRSDSRPCPCAATPTIRADKETPTQVNPNGKPLSPCERAAIERLCAGRRVKEIAADLRITVRAAQRRLAKAVRKLDAGTLAGAAYAYACATIPNFPPGGTLRPATPRRRRR